MTVRRSKSDNRTLKSLALKSSVALPCMMMALPTIAQAQDDEIIVTGSLIKREQPIDGATPIATIGVDDIQLNGFTDIFEALAPQPFFTGFVDNDPRSGANGAQRVNLRGLGTDFTLVLLNGRRMARSDLNLVPFAAVERIEVLKDGASTTYGSDALAGVVNIITRTNYDGAQLTAEYSGPTDYSGGDEFRTAFVGGASNDRGSVTFSVEYIDAGEISALEHPLGRSDDLTEFGLFDARSQANNPGVITRQDGTQLMLDPSFGPGQTGAAISDFVAPYNNPIEKRQVDNFQNNREAITLFSSGTFELFEDKMEAYGDILYKETYIDFVDHRGTIINGEGGSQVVPASNFYNPFGEDVTVNYRLDYGTGPGRLERPVERVEATTRTRMFTAGVRGDLNLFRYDIAYSDNESNINQVHDGLSRRLIDQQLALSTPDALNLFGNAAVTPEMLAPAQATFSRRLTQKIRQLTGIVQFSPYTLPAGDIEVAGGAELRNSRFSFIRDEALNIFQDAGSLTFLNDPSEANDRSINSFFAEMNVPIFSDLNARPGFHELEFNAAFRREDVSDAGSATVPRFSARWAPLADGVLVLRGSYSESFRAPNLNDLTPQGDVNVDPQTDPLILDPATGQPLVYDVERESGGNPNLDPTTAEYINAGLVFRPKFVPGLTFSVDYFNLSQQDAFVRPGAQAVINGDSPGEVIRADTPTPGDVFAGAPVGRIIRVNNRIANAATRDITGFDINLLYDIETDDFGSFNFATYNTLLTKFEYDQADGDGVQDALGFFDGNFGGVPEYRGNYVLTHRIGGLASTVNVSYTSGVTNTFLPEDRTVNSLLRTDLTFAYTFEDVGPESLLNDTTLTFNVDNVFNEEVDPFAVTFARGVRGDPSFANFWPGRVITVQLRKDF